MKEAGCDKSNLSCSICRAQVTSISLSRKQYRRARNLKLYDCFRSISIFARKLWMSIVRSNYVHVPNTGDSSKFYVLKPGCPYICQAYTSNTHKYGKRAQHFFSSLQKLGDFESSLITKRIAISSLYFHVLLYYQQQHYWGSLRIESRTIHEQRIRCSFSWAPKSVVSKISSNKYPNHKK